MLGLGNNALFEYLSRLTKRELAELRTKLNSDSPRNNMLLDNFLWKIQVVPAASNKFLPIGSCCNFPKLN